VKETSGQSEPGSPVKPELPFKDNLARFILFRNFRGSGEALGVNFLSVKIFGKIFLTF